MAFPEHSAQPAHWPRSWKLLAGFNSRLVSRWQSLKGKAEPRHFGARPQEAGCRATIGSVRTGATMTDQKPLTPPKNAKHLGVKAETDNHD